MIGSAALAAFIAHLAFPVLLYLGWARGTAGPRTLAMFALVGAAAWLGLPLMGGGLFVTPAFACLDVVLVLVVFRGDVRLTG